MNRQHRPLARSAAGILGGALAVLALLSGCAKQKAADALETLRLGVMTDSITDYAATIGTAEGIFAKHGFKAEIASFAAGINTIDAVTTGQMDIGFGADFAVLNRFGGSADTPLRIFAGLGEGRLDSYKLYAKGEGIRSPADLAGKPVVVHLGTVGEYWYARTLEASGLSMKAVTSLPIESAMEGVALIQNGSAVASWGAARTAEALAAIPGVHPIADLSAVGTPTLSVAVATETFLRERQGAAVKYLLAMQEIYDFIAQNPQRAAETVNKSLSAPVGQVLSNIKSQTNYIDFNRQVFDGLNNLYLWAEANGVVRNRYSLPGYINIDALKAAFPGRGDYSAR